MSTSTPRRLGRPPAMVDGRTVPERLIDAALQLFAENGFERTSVQDVVAAAGVTKGAMYHYFDSKDDLLAEIYARVLRLQMQRLEGFVSSDAPLEERVHGAAADVIRTTLENVESTTVFFRSLHQLTPAKQDEVRDQRRRYHDLFRGMLVEGQAAGTFRDDVAADLLVDYYFGSVHHLPTWWRADRGPEPAEVGDTFATLFLDSLRRS